MKPEVPQNTPHKCLTKGLTRNRRIKAVFIGRKQSLKINRCWCVPMQEQAAVQAMTLGGKIMSKTYWAERFGGLHDALREQRLHRTQNLRLTCCLYALQPRLHRNSGALARCRSSGKRRLRRCALCPACDLVVDEHSRAWKALMANARIVEHSISVDGKRMLAVKSFEAPEEEKPAAPAAAK